MRDFRDAKAMAHTLRAALAAKGLKITVSESLELIAKAFGVADWNTLAATVRAEALNRSLRRQLSARNADLILLAAEYGLRSVSFPAISCWRWCSSSWSSMTPRRAETRIFRFG